MEKATRTTVTALLADNVISALGFTTDENFQNVRRGISGLTRYNDRFDLPEPFVAAAIDSDRLADAFARLTQLPPMRYTPLEQAAILSATDALQRAGIDAADPRVLFILSSTKGNVFLLDSHDAAGYDPQQRYLWHSAELIARCFGNPNPPPVVSNACISGASALIAAQRALRSGRYDYAVVTGVDMLSRFVVSGFQSFKALSPEPCRPFDANRAGLNVGETAATIVLAQLDPASLPDGSITLTCGAVCNDANHISGPSRTGEGAFRALQRILTDVDRSEIAFVNAHGTATPYNDEMESIAITRAGLNHTPVNSLKGYFGHTLGAAGVLESIIATHALNAGIALATHGFEQLGVSSPLPIVTHTKPVAGHRCVNMLSGFGGCNAALLYTRLKR